MNPEDHRLPSDPFGNIFCSAIESAIERLLVEGTRHGVDLKASDKLIDRNTELISQNPTSSLLKADQTRKITARDESLKLIEELAIGITKDLHRKLLENSSTTCHLQPTLSPGQQPNRFHPRNLPDSSLDQTETKSPPVDLANDLKILHKRIGKHAHEIERIDCEHQVAIDGLQQQIGAQKKAIRTLREILPNPSSSPSPAALNPQNVNESNQPILNPRENSSSNQADPGEQSSTQLLELRGELDRLDGQINELKSSVQTILTKEIPVNLHQSVQFMQQDLNLTVQSALTNGHHQLTQLIRDLVGRFEPRIAELERSAAQLESFLPNLLPVKLDPPSGTASPTSKPPRLLRRLSSALSPDAKLIPKDESEECNQQ